MATAQLRIYQLQPGAYEGFLRVFREQLIPARAAHGFKVVGAWYEAEQNRFTWVVAHDGDFEAADRVYYASPERAAVSPEPGSFIASMDVRLLSSID